MKRMGGIKPHLQAAQIGTTNNPISYPNAPPLPHDGSNPGLFDGLCGCLHTAEQWRLYLAMSSTGSARGWRGSDPQLQRTERQSHKQ